MRPVRLLLLTSVFCLCACATTGYEPKLMKKPSVEIESLADLKLLQREQDFYFAETEYGTQVSYTLPELPWVKFDLFAYPIGVSDDLPDVLEKLKEGFRMELQVVADAGVQQSEPFVDQRDFEVATHRLTAKGWRGRFYINKPDGSTRSSLVYLFYRPPFALKVRATSPDHAPEVSDQAVDEAVRELIPRVGVRFPKARCKAAEIRVPEHLDAMPKEQQQKILAYAMARGILEAALDGCQDLEVALRMTDIVCKEQQALCGSPPWSNPKDQP